MKNNIFYLVFFILLLVVYRIIPHPPNFTPILASAVVGPFLIKNRLFGLAIPIIAMFISDAIIGFHPYQFVVYSTILSIGLIAPLSKKYLYFGLLSLFASVWFFITTNFAVWVIWDYYPKTFDGLIICYVAAIPFFQNTLLSTIFFTGLLIFLVKYIDIVKEKIFNMFVLESKL